MRSRKMTMVVALAASAIVFGPAGASAWVRVAVAPVARVAGAAAVGVAAGAVTGAAVASASRPYYYPPTSTTTVINNPAPAPAASPSAVGTVVTTLPSGCVSTGGRYQCGSVWYQPYFGGNGVYYQVVAP